MHRFLMIASLSLLCSGCLTAQEQTDELAAADDASCKSQGANPGTDAYVLCREAKDEQHPQNRAIMALANSNEPSPLSYNVPVPVELAPPPVVITTAGNCANTPIENSFSSSCF